MANPPRDRSDLPPPPDGPPGPGELADWTIGRAVRENRPDVLTRLFAAGLTVPDYFGDWDDHDPPEERWGDTWLYLAARNGFAEAVRLLAAAGEPLDGIAAETDPETPLTAAVRAGHTDTVRALLEAGADPLGGAGEQEAADYPALRAARAGRRAAVELFRGRVPADVSGLADRLLAQRAVRRTPADRALHKAAAGGDVAGVAAALAAGANLEATDRDGLTALHQAAGHDHLAAVEALLAAGAARDPVGIDPPWTPLYWAAAHMRDPAYTPDRPGKVQTQVVAALAAAGAAADWADADGVTALFHASKRPDLGMMRALLAAGADPNRRLPGSRLTPLLALVSLGSAVPGRGGRLVSLAYYCGWVGEAAMVEAVNLLLAAGADPHAVLAGGRDVATERSAAATTGAAKAAILAARRGR